MVHEVMGGVDCSFTPQGGAYPYLGGQKELTEPWDEGSQADFSDKTSEVHPTAMGLRSPLLLQSPCGWAP